MVNYNILTYLIGEGFKNVFKNKKSTFAALMIMFVTMITAGLGLAGASNISAVMKQLEQDVPITLYVKDELKEQELTDISDYIKTIDGVNTNLYAIKLTDIKKSSEVVEELKNAEVLKDKIAEINSSDVVMNGLRGIDRGVKIVFIGMGILLIVVSTVIISNTIKLTVHARRREISIMKYVGATNNFIRAPFIVEGVVIGITAIAVSLLSLGAVYHLIYGACNNILISNFNVNMLQFSDIFKTILMVYIVLGIGIGVRKRFINEKIFKGIICERCNYEKKSIKCVFITNYNY